MNATDAIEQIKKALGFSVETQEESEVSNEAVDLSTDEVNETEVVENSFAELEGVEGQLFVVEGEIEIGKDVQIKLEDESFLPVPDGEYELKNSYILGVEGGKIVSYEEVEKEEEEVVEETPESVEEAPISEEETKEEEKMSDELVNLITQVVKEVHNQMKEEMSEVKTEIDEIKTEFNEFKTKPAGKKITSNVQQKFSEYDDKVVRLIKLGKSLNK